MALDAASIEIFLGYAVGIAEVAAKLTPTKIDDNAVAVIKELKEKPWFHDFVVFITNKFGLNGNAPLSVASFTQAVNEFAELHKAANPVA